MDDELYNYNNVRLQQAEHLSTTTFLTLDPTVALLQYSLALVLMLFGSIVNASEYNS